MTADGKILDISEGITIRKISHTEAVYAIEYKNQTGYAQTVSPVNLSAHYSDHLFVFDPNDNKVHIFETLHGHFRETIQLDLAANNDSCVKIASKNNLACLFAKPFMYVFDLDKLLAIIHAQAHLQPDVKRQKLDSDLTPPQITVGDEVMKTVNYPVVESYVQSALIYGPYLYAAEPMRDKNSIVLLHYTDANKLLGWDQEVIHWQHTVLVIPFEVLSHVRKRWNHSRQIQLFNIVNFNENYDVK